MATCLRKKPRKPYSNVLYCHLKVTNCCVLTDTKNKAAAAGKASKEEQEKKKQELEKRLQDVSGQLGAPPKKAPKKGIVTCNVILKCKRDRHIIKFC